MNRERRTQIAVFVMTAALVLGSAQFLRAAYIPIKAVVAQLLLEHAWHRTLTSGKGVKPWPWADTRAFARLDAPRLAAHAVVLEGASGEALAFGPAHLASTPQAGASGTTVFAGHRDTHFRFLSKLHPGDDLIVTNADGTHYRYRVTEARVVRANAYGVPLASAAAAAELALVTCYPFGALTPTKLRYVVTARLESRTVAAR